MEHTNSESNSQKREDRAEIRPLKVEDLKPYFENPVKWCDPTKLKRFIQLWESAESFPPIEVVEELPKELKHFHYGSAVEVLGEPMAKRLNSERIYTITDGHHRWFSAYLTGHKTIMVRVTPDIHVIHRREASVFPRVNSIAISCV